LITSYRPPIIVKKIFSDFIWETSNNKILLTFDDGPTESSTLKILEILNRNKIKAVFFCEGRNIKKYPDLTTQMISEGHVIANHSMTHKLITKISKDEASEEIQSFNNLMKEKFNYEVKYFRPPHGRFNLRTNGLLKNLNLKCVMWSLLSHDYENEIHKVKYGIDEYLKRKSIIVFHDNINSTSIIEESLIYTIESAARKGYEFGEIEDCLK
jgi:peptidoglycan/xylan/chitin deacetylase (PgdA/CDA1 family)